MPQAFSAFEEKIPARADCEISWVCSTSELRLKKKIVLRDPGLTFILELIILMVCSSSCLELSLYIQDQGTDP